MSKEIERSVNAPLYLEPKTVQVEDVGEFTISQSSEADGRCVTQITTTFQLYALGDINDYNEDDTEAVTFIAAVNGVESLMLALAAEGIDITEPKVVLAIQSAMIAVTNNCLD